MAEGNKSETPETPLSEIPSNIISEFFVPIFGWIIPGAIFVWLYGGDIKVPTLPDKSSLLTFIFFCVAWVVGAVIDVGSHGIMVFLFWITKARCWFFWLNHDHDYIFELRKDEKRMSAWYVYEKILFRSMGVIFVVIYFFPPPSLRSTYLHSLNIFWCFVLCVICWLRVQWALNSEEKKHKQKKRREP